MLALTPMRARDPDEQGRSATTLELFFDLVFVVAVGAAGLALHHELTEGHVTDGVTRYLMLFFAIWWAWMNFTWFATSFDCDDWLYRLLTVVQMGGVLILAAGAEDVFTDTDFTLVTIGYAVMRLAMVPQWLRAAADPTYTATARRYAVAITAVQVLWVGRLLLPETLGLIGFFVLVAAELAIPPWAEQKTTTPWHTHHITERYGLFTLILLGESLLAAANAIIEAVHEEAELLSLTALAALALVVTASLWWTYFWPPHHQVLTSLPRALRYGYLHYAVFAAAGAISAGVEVEVDALTGHTELSDAAATATLTVPIAVFLLGVWVTVIASQRNRVVNIAVPTAAALVLLDSLVPVPVALSAAVLVALVVVLVTQPPVEEPR